MDAFKKELEELINKHSIENKVDMPDFMLSNMICRMIEATGPSIKEVLDWHGCDSVTHPSPDLTGSSPVYCQCCSCGKILAVDRKPWACGPFFAECECGRRFRVRVSVDDVPTKKSTSPPSVADMGEAEEPCQKE